MEKEVMVQKGKKILECVEKIKRTELSEIFGYTIGGLSDVIADMEAIGKNLSQGYKPSRVAMALAVQNLEGFISLSDDIVRFIIDEAYVDMDKSNKHLDEFLEIVSCITEYTTILRDLEYGTLGLGIGGFILGISRERVEQMIEKYKRKIRQRIEEMRYKWR